MLMTRHSDGPVINVDDDSRMEPSLFDKIWRVRRAIFWQVGNIDGCELGLAVLRYQQI